MKRTQKSLLHYYSTHIHPRLVISAGFAGSRCSSLKPCEWICAQRVDHETDAPIEGPLLLTLPSLREASVLSCERIHPTPNMDHPVEYHLDRQPSPALDMESYALVQVTKKHATPAMIVRMITDNPEYPLPIALLHFTNSTLEARLTRAISHFFQGVGSTLSSPVKMAKFLRAGFHWSELLSEGWMRLAPEILQLAFSRDSKST